MTHPVGTFICIYSSWLTCHSPSSNVSIQGTIIYRIIFSRTPHRLPCQVTSGPTLVTSRGRTTLSIPAGTAWWWGNLHSTEFCPPILFLSASWCHPEHPWPTCHRTTFQTCADKGALPITVNSCQGSNCVSFPWSSVRVFISS